MPPARRPDPPAPKVRFRSNDAYRADREWQRLEGTPQRALFRELRERFLERHPGSGRWALDAGSGPGRFTARLGPRADSRPVALDIGRTALEALADRWPRGPGAAVPPDRVLADAAAPPFAPGSFGTVAALGNLLGFAGAESERVAEQLVGLLSARGTLLLEIAPGPGERSRYLHRLPPGAVARLLRAPLPVLRARIEREGFSPEPSRRPAHDAFRRLDAAELTMRLRRFHLSAVETTAVAPALGADPARLAAVAADPRAWARLRELEELLGREPARWPHASAVLLALERRAPAR